MTRIRGDLIYRRPGTGVNPNKEWTRLDWAPNRAFAMMPLGYAKRDGNCWVFGVKPDPQMVVGRVGTLHECAVRLLEAMHPVYVE